MTGTLNEAQYSPDHRKETDQHEEQSREPGDDLQNRHISPPNRTPVSVTMNPGSGYPTFIAGAFSNPFRPTGSLLSWTKCTRGLLSS